LGPYSEFLRRKREEIVSQHSELAHLGLRAAVAATQFRSLDKSLNGTLEVDDLVRAFARVDGLSANKARAMARITFDNIVRGSQGEVLQLRVAHTHKIKKEQLKRAGTATIKQSQPVITFSEFADIVTSANNIPFKRFLEMVPEPDDIAEAVEMQKVFDEEQALEAAARAEPKTTKTPKTPNRATGQATEMRKLGSALDSVGTADGVAPTQGDLEGLSETAGTAGELRLLKAEHRAAGSHEMHAAPVTRLEAEACRASAHAEEAHRVSPHAEMGSDWL